MARVTNVRLSINGLQVATAQYGEIGLPNEHKLTLHGTTWQGGHRQALQYLERPCQINADGPPGAGGQPTPYRANLTVTGIVGDMTTVHLD